MKPGFLKFVSTLIVLFFLATAAQVQIGSPMQATTSSHLIVQNKDHVLVNTDLVTLTVSVADGQGRYVAGLHKSDFTIADNHVTQEITFFSDEDIPVSVAVIFDMSASMDGSRIRHAKEALAQFIQTSHEKDEYTLLEFDSRVYDLLDRTHDADALLAKLSDARPHGNTAVYDAIFCGLESLDRSEYRKRTILLISDGEDNSSRYALNELRRRLQESDVIVYAIGLVQNASPKEALMKKGPDTLRNLASITGGKAFFPNNNSEMIEALDRIALELRHQYSIGYRPAPFVADGKWRRLKVTVTPPPQSSRLVVRTREGYFAIESLNTNRRAGKISS